MTPPVTVTIPVGPSAANKRWLGEAIESVGKQTYPKVDLLLVDDMAELLLTTEVHSMCWNLGIPYTVYEMPWYSGVAHAFNAGVAKAPSDLVFMLGSDDYLEPDCIELCVAEYEAKRGDPYGYYYVGVRYLDTNETQDVACHAAMVTKALWHRTGGLPIQSASGASDSALLSIMLRHYPRAGRQWLVANGKPLYNYRRHAETDTASKADWQGVILNTRHLVTLEWQPRHE